MLATRNSKITSGLLGSFLSRRYSSGAAIKTLVLAEHNNVSLGPSTLNAIAAARAVGGTVSVVVAGWQCEKAAAAAAQAEGVDKVLRVEHKSFAHPVAETLSPLLLAMQETGKYSHIVAPATTFGKNVIPRVAAKLDVSPVAEVVEIKGADTFVRPIYAGNALSTVKSSDNVKLLTIRTAAFPKVPVAASPAIIEDVPPPAALSDTPVLSEWVSDELSVSTRPELASARVVVAGGRGLKSGENFKLLEELADKLNGAVGASRAAVDAGYVPNDLQIGQTGKVVAPELYIGVGISGAIQHLAGMKDSKVIVAINKDPDAPIFQVADYGLVGDLFTLMPEISAAVAKKS